MRPKILCVAGARPNFMKIAPILRAFAARPELTARLVHTGQHYDDALSKAFFDDLELRKPDIELRVGSGSHAQQTADILRAFEPVLHAEQPHAVLVVGDVNSTLACALAASKYALLEPFSCALGARTRPLVLHVEAGLRSFDDDMPEETNRRLTDAISDALFVTEPSGIANLTREGAPLSRIHFVGNVMIDSLLAARARAETSGMLEHLGLRPGAYGLVTLHRPSNVDDAPTLRALVATLDELAAALPLVFPMHPRTRAQAEAAGITFDPTRLRVTAPLGYFDFLKLMTNARVVLTDSGGIQEETTALGVRCVTLRDSTERPVTVTEGTNLLAGTTPEGIRRAFDASLVAPRRHAAPHLWDGRAAVRICEVVGGIFGG